MQIAYKLVIAAGALCTVALAISVASRWWASTEEASYLSGIPVPIEVEAPIFIDGRSGFREGCGVAVFRVSERTLIEIRTQGLAFFRDARVGRDNGRYFRYQEWKTTPPRQDERTLRALGCAKITPSLAAAIEGASVAYGSYFTVGYEYDLLLIPNEGYIVLTFSG